MNSSVNASTATQPLRDTFATAVVKNVVVVALCLTINYINSTLVHTFFRNRIFSENPRYILYIHLVLNDMMQLTIAGLLHVLSYAVYTLNVSFCCFLLMIAVFTTLNTPLNLASMAIERYIAVCRPLRHAQICTPRRTYGLIGLIWVMGAMPILPDLFILLATEPLSFFHTRIFCSRPSVFRHPYLVEKKTASHIVYLTLVWLTLVYTYFQIMFAAKAAKSDARKARNTILLHGAQLLMCMFTYIGPVLDTLFLYLSPSMKFTSYLIVHILPRLLSPIIYGLRDQAFCKYLKNYYPRCKCNMRRVPHNKTSTRQIKPLF